MNPFYFGSSNEPIYGVYHPPKSSSARDEGVVLCYPFGQEYMRAHRAFRQLSMLLANKGYHVLRFDYRGTGDSSLALSEATIEKWMQDVESAVEELRETAAVSKINVVALRLGALMAANLCAESDAVDRLVVWDPVRCGADYQDELLADIDDASKLRGKFVDTDNTLHFNGFGLSQQLRNGINGLDLRTIIPVRARQVLQIVSHESEPFNTIREAWSTLPGYRYQYTAAPHDWNFVDNFGGILLPQPVIQAIVNWLD
jgi:pimeloyl-ACP methyl ester carboxylesterase